MWEGFESYLQKKMNKLLIKPFRYWRAHAMGIIDENGNKLREPETSSEKQIYNVFDELIRKIKYTMIKYIPNKGLIRHKVFKDFLSKDAVEKFSEAIKVQGVENVVVESTTLSDLVQIISEESNYEGNIEWKEIDSEIENFIQNDSLYHVTTIEIASKIKESGVFLTSEGNIGKNGLSTTYDSSLVWGRGTFKFILSYSKLKADYPMIFVDEKVGCFESEVKILRDKPIPIKKYVTGYIVGVES